MTRLLTAAAVLALSAGVAFAGSMDVRFTNTVKLTAADGTSTSLLYNADGTFTATGAQAGSGTWVLEGENICITPAGGEKQCGPLKGEKVGDTWEIDTPNGKLTGEIVAGR